MARIEGFRAALGGFGKTRETGIVVHGMPYLSRREIPELLGVPPSSLLRGDRARQAQKKLEDGMPIWPLDLVREQVARSPKLSSLLDRLPQVTSNQFVPLEDARAAFPTRTHEEFLQLLEREQARPMFVVPTAGGEARLMVPARVLAASTPAADAVAGAVAAGAGRARTAPKARVTARAATSPPESVVTPNPKRAADQTPQRTARPARRVAGDSAAAGRDWRREAGAEQAVTGATGSVRRPSRSVLLVGGAGAGVAGIIALAPTNRPNGGTDAAPPPQDQAKPAAPAEPAAPAPSVEEAAEQRREALGARIATVAAGEVAKGVVATWGPDGRATGEVAKYFATSARAKPTNDYDWPAYFAAWVREEAGDPITPGADWLTIRDLIGHAKATGTWRGRDHEARPGDVVFFTTPKVGDETGNNVGVVRAVTDDQLLVARGWVKDGDREKVDELPLDRSSHTIGGYAVVSP